MLRLLAATVLLAVPAFAAGPIWKPLQGDGFTISFPGDAKRSDRLESTSAGDVRMVNYELASEDGASYLLLSVSDLDPALMKLATPRETLENARDGALRQEQGEVRSQRAITLETTARGKKKRYPGLEFEAALPGGVTVLARIYLVENRLYQVIAQFDPGHARRDDFKKFAASFRLKPRTPSSARSDARAIGVRDPKLGILGCAGCGTHGSGLLEHSDGGSIVLSPETDTASAAGQ